MSAARSLLVLSLAGLCACEGTAGEARIELFDPASAAPLWRQTVPSQWFTVGEAAPPGVLRIHTSDYCWDSNYVMDFARDSGELLAQRKSEARALTGGSSEPLAPPTTCASGHVTQRTTLSDGDLVDLCAHTHDGVLAVSNVADGRERLRLKPATYSPALIAGDRLLVHGSEPARIDAHSLLSGELLWSWPAPDAYTVVAGADAERVYLHSETSRESHALALAGGSVVWQKDLACDALSLEGDVLVCRQTLRDSSCEQE